MASTYLGELADSLLSAGLAALVPASTGRPAPTVSYISHGPPALARCCDGMLTVHLKGIAHDIAFVNETQQHPCGVEHRPTFVLTLARCYPSVTTSGQPSTAGVLDNAGADLLEDLWALVTEISDRIAACTLFPGQGSCQDAEIGQVDPLEAEGQCAGWTIEVTFVTNDSGPTGS